MTVGRRLAAAVVLAALGAAGCARPAVGDGGRLLVVATFATLGQFAARVGGERVVVRTLVPPGAPPHDYEPTPRDVAALERAAVVVYLGGGFEPYLDRLLPALPSSVVRVDAGEHAAARFHDPHIWLDPVLAVGLVEAIRQGLTRADPAGRARYAAGAAALRRELEAVRRRYAEVLARCRRREFVTAHAAFGYLAARFGLREVPIAGVAPQGEVSPARLGEIVAFIRRSGATVVFTEPGGASRAAEVVAHEAGVRLDVLDPLEGQTGRSYFVVMDDNLRRLAEGLDCRR
jgi:zinc transport system substrate-binding protein